MPARIASNRTYSAFRPDKIVMQQNPTNQAFDKYYWKATAAEIVGKEAIPSFAEKGEDASLVSEDNIVRTPSDHMGIVADFVYSK